jgi:hypothetical protein
MIAIEDDGNLVCNHCFHQVPYLIDNEKPSYKEPPKEVCFYAYRRINHFREILAQIQGKETTKIEKDKNGNDIMNNIRNQLAKERIEITKENLNYETMKNILKKLEYSKWYEHIYLIRALLGIPPPVMSAQLEEKLCNLFTRLQAPYSKYCPDDRVNFLNYYHTLYKLLVFLKEYSYLQYIPMLKDDEKILEQDDILEQCFSDLEWDYEPTLPYEFYMQYI